MRLKENTPVLIALREALTPARTTPGRPKNTWLKTVFHDLAQGDIHLKAHSVDEVIRTLKNITRNRKVGRRIL